MREGTSAGLVGWVVCVCTCTLFDVIPKLFVSIQALLPQLVFLYLLLTLSPQPLPLLSLLPLVLLVSFPLFSSISSSSHLHSSLPLSQLLNQLLPPPTSPLLLNLLPHFLLQPVSGVIIFSPSPSFMSSFPLSAAESSLSSHFSTPFQPSSTSVPALTSE